MCVNLPNSLWLEVEETLRKSEENKYKISHTHVFMTSAGLELHMCC